MFATWTPTPIFYERYVTRGGGGERGRNWHYHELNPTLNRKRLKDALSVRAGDGKEGWSPRN